MSCLSSRILLVNLSFCWRRVAKYIQKCFPCDLGEHVDAARSNDTSQHLGRYRLRTVDVMTGCLTFRRHIKRELYTASYLRENNVSSPAHTSHSIGHWDNKYFAPSGSWVGPWTGKAGDDVTWDSEESMWCTRLPIPIVISVFAKGELTRSRFRTCSQPAMPLQTGYLLFVSVSVFNSYGLCARWPKTRIIFSFVIMATS